MTGGILACRFSSFLPVPPFLPSRSSAIDQTTSYHRQGSLAGPWHARFEPRLIGAGGRSVADRVNGRAQRRPGDGIGHLGQPIVHPQPVPARSNETSPPQMGEMPRDCRLRES